MSSPGKGSIIPIKDCKYKDGHPNIIPRNWDLGPLRGSQGLQGWSGVEEISPPARFRGPRKLPKRTLNTQTPTPRALKLSRGFSGSNLDSTEGRAQEELNHRQKPWL